MSGIRSIKRHPTLVGYATASSAPIYVDSDDNILKFVPAGSGLTEVQIVDVSSTQTLTNKTISGSTAGSPEFTGDPNFTGDPQGIVVVKKVVFTETATGTSYVGTVPIPAGATLLGLQVTSQALWTPTTSASMIVGDTADPNGFFDAIDLLAAADLLVGEVLDINSADNWGGTEGAYLVAMTGRRGPAATNFGTYYAAGSNIVGTITVVDPEATPTGITIMTVAYARGEAIAAVVTP